MVLFVHTAVLSSHEGKERGEKWEKNDGNMTEVIF